MLLRIFTNFQYHYERVLVVDMASPLLKPGEKTGAQSTSGPRSPRSPRARGVAKNENEVLEYCVRVLLRACTHRMIVCSSSSWLFHNCILF
jgi:hypothetical protein